MLRTSGLALLWSCVVAFSAFAFADDAAADKVSYYKQIRPIFQAQCQGCHQPAKAQGGFIMTSFDRLLGGGESGEKAIVPGQPDASHLLAEIKVTDGKAEMPKPDGKGELPKTAPVNTDETKKAGTEEDVNFDASFHLKLARSGVWISVLSGMLKS